MMAPVNIPQPTFPITTAPFLDDQWDGYSAERAKIYDTLFTYNRTNFVVLTGDIHSSWANDLPLLGYNSSSGAGSAGVEFVATSVTSQNFPFPVSQSIIQNFNGHIKYADLTSHGYLIVDVNKQRTQGDWVNVSTISQQTYSTSNAASWRCNNGETFLRSSASPATANPNRYPVLAPLEPRDRSIGTSEVNGDGMESVLLGAYPNPVSRQLTTQFALHQSADVSLQLIDLAGRVVLSEQLGSVSAGIHRTSLQVESLPAGVYILSVRLGNKLQQRQIIKH
jgi:alkaline phosphatase D